LFIIVVGMVAGIILVGGGDVVDGAVTVAIGVLCRVSVLLVM